MCLLRKRFELPMKVYEKHANDEIDPKLQKELLYRIFFQNLMCLKPKPHINICCQCQIIFTVSGFPGMRLILAYNSGVE